MQKPEFLPLIADPARTLDERLIRVCQFVLYNGLLAPVELMDQTKLPRGYVFRGYLLRDLLLCLAFPSAEAAANPTSAEAESGQLWQLGLSEKGAIDTPRNAVLCTLNGVLTRVMCVDNPRRSRLLLEEWVKFPPTAEELAPPVA